jgi:soluble lytic murein transglycosylase-like protein
VTGHLERKAVFTLGSLPVIFGMIVFSSRAFSAPDLRPVMKAPAVLSLPLVSPRRWDAGAAPHEDLFQKIGKETGLDPRLLKAITAAESRFKIDEISPAGACGLMQLMPRTAKILAVQDIFNPEQNIRGGARHFRYLMDRFSNNLTLALAAYNAGERPVLRHRGVPPYPETQKYVRKVLNFYTAPLS